MRRRNTWFPNVGSPLGEAGTETNAAGKEILFLTVNTDTVNTIITELTFDEPQDDDSVLTAETSLADIVGSEYILERIVGKCFIHRDSGDISGLGIDFQPAVMVGAGFFVARANDRGVAGVGASQPVGSGTLQERANNYSALEVDAIREPWIWRRVWLLGTAGGVRATSATDRIPIVASLLLGNGNQNAAGFYPCSTAVAASAVDGPHIDSKVNRRVTQENRLWFSLSACPFPFTAPADPSLLRVRGVLDYRILGRLVKAHGTSAF